MRMLLSIISIVMNVIYYAVLRMNLYTDRALMPYGEIREWRRSPIDRLYISDQPVLLYLQLAFAAVSVITGLLMLFGVKNSILKTVQLVSAIASTAMFIVIMIVTGNAHVRYA